ncbi:1794_t:CDS:2, partial [Paraglomus brasilianum]
YILASRSVSATNDIGEPSEFRSLKSNAKEVPVVSLLASALYLGLRKQVRQSARTRILFDLNSSSN